jgi:hypothetical protein
MAGGVRGVHGNALPNYLNAEIPADKLMKYALDPAREARDPFGSHGKNKARVFKSALGFDQSNWELLKQRILEELPYHEAVPRDEDEHGKRYTVVLPITGPNGVTANVLTGWIVEPGSDYPRLSTARVVTGRR